MAESPNRMLRPQAMPPSGPVARSGVPGPPGVPCSAYLAKPMSTDKMAADSAAEQFHADQLKAHIFHLSKEQSSFADAAAEWEFFEQEDNEEGVHVCPCGKIGLRYYCYIYNPYTHKVTHVGTECIGVFGEQLAGVVSALRTCTSFNATYAGTDKYGRPTFKILASHSLVRRKAQLDAYFHNKTPVSLSGKSWRIAIQKTSTTFVEYVTYRLTVSYRRAGKEKQLVAKLVSAVRL